MIKFNEVTWYSKFAAMIVFLIILPILAFYIGTQYEEVKNTDEIYIPDVITAKKEITQNSTTSEFSVYINKIYGWSFHYPNNWVVSENINGNVILSSKAVVSGAVRPDALSPAMTITLSTIKKSGFKPLNSKVGNIIFDVEQNALVDGLNTPSRCLSTTGYLGEGNSIASFMYAGSNMSNPAYSNSAIITDNDYMVLLLEDTYGIPADQNEWEEMKNGVKKIYSTFKLADGVRGIIPACTR